MKDALKATYRIILEPMIGFSIEDVASEAIFIAQATGKVVDFNFNGLNMVATQYSTPSNLADEYRNLTAAGMRR